MSENAEERFTDDFREWANNGHEVGDERWQSLTKLAGEKGWLIFLWLIFGATGAAIYPNL